MPRSSVLLRKPTLTPPSTNVQLVGASTALATGTAAPIASSRRVPTGVVATAVLGTIRPPNAATLLSMANRSLTEGDSGTTNMTFSLVRGSDPWGPIAFDYQTIAGTAQAGVDYTAVSGSGTISSGQTVNINVPIIGDVEDESDETFTLRISRIRYS
jgi:Calx-beta domain-containing protein